MSQVALLSNYQFSDDQISTEDLNEFKFKYAKQPDLERVVKNVRRSRRKEEEERLWEEYCNNQNNLINSDPSAIKASYIVKPPMATIAFPCNTSEDNLFKSGAITITSNAKDSNTSTNVKIDTSEDAQITSDSTDGSDTNDTSDSELIEIHELEVLSSGDKAIKGSVAPAEIDSEEDIPIKKVRENICVTKLRTFRKRISMVLDGIRISWDKTPKPDGDEDYVRRQKRANEFGNRFSRYYLYHLGRQMLELRNLMIRSPRRGNTQIFYQKMVNAHKIILEALQAYLRHMPSSIPGGLPDKLKELLMFSCDLWKLCSKYEVMRPDAIPYDPDNHDVCVEDINTKCKLILQKIDSICNKESEDNIYTGSESQSTLLGRKDFVPKKIAKLKKNNINNNRYSMYALDGLMKKLSKKAIKPTQSKPKRAPKNKAKIEKKESTTDINKQLNDSAVENKTIRDDRVSVPPREDDIVTQMDVLTKKEKEEEIAAAILKAEMSEKQAHMNKMEKDDKLALFDESKEKMKKELQGSLQPLLSDLLKAISNDTDNQDNDIEQLKTVLTQIKNMTDNDNINVVVEDKNKKCKTPSSRSSPLKNVKLICLPPANELPLMPMQTESVATNTSRTDIEGGEKQQRPASKTMAADCLSEKETSPLQSPTPAAPYKVQLRMPQPIFSRLIKYREQYANYSRGNNLYVVKKGRKPWEIISRISDQLLDEALDNVTQEVDIDKHLLKLYEMEFK